METMTLNQQIAKLQGLEVIPIPDYSNNIADAFPLLLEMPCELRNKLLLRVSSSIKIFCEAICKEYIKWREET